jgi:hypothetical protein
MNLSPLRQVSRASSDSFADATVIFYGLPVPVGQTAATLQYSVTDVGLATGTVYYYRVLVRNAGCGARPWPSALLTASRQTPTVLQLPPPDI